MSMAAPTIRRTQEERREATKARLLQATLDTIVESGWARTSTARICEKAGVSRGAQTHHYKTKADLLVAAVGKNTSDFDELVAPRVKEGAAEPLGLGEYLELLWDACLEGALLESWTEAMVSARTDPLLRESVAVVDRNAIEAMRAIGPELYSDDAEAALVSDLVELTVYLLRGMVVQRGVHPDETERRRLFEMWCSIVEAKIDAVQESERWPHPKPSVRRFDLRRGSCEYGQAAGAVPRPRAG